MKIEVGKAYRLRTGEKVTVVSRTRDSSPFNLLARRQDGSRLSLTTEGKFSITSEYHGLDIVEEYEEPSISDFLSVVQAFYNGELIVWRMKGSGDPWESLEYSDPLWNLEKYEYKVKHVGREFWLAEIAGKMTVLDDDQSCSGSFKVREVIEEE